MSEVWIWLGVAVVILVIWLLRIGKRAQQADWGNEFLNSLDGLNRLFCKHYHRLKYDQISLPEAGGAIVAANHVSGLDPLLMSCACKKPLRYMIATEEYERPLLRWLYKTMGAIPVDREGAPEKAFYAALKALDEGEFVTVYPQGRITLPGESVALKRGVVLLADLAEAPIIPVRLSGISGVGKVFPAIFMRSRARLEVGPPIYVTGPKDKEALSELGSFISASRAAEGPLLSSQN